MRNQPLILLVAASSSCVLLLSCSSVPKNTEPPVISSTSSTVGGAVITDEMVGRRRGEMKLSESSTDPNYAFSEKSPVGIGGGFESGSDRTYKYLNSLRAPNGQPITYSRVGTCCPFKSANSPFDGEALLEVYELSIPGVAAGKRIYFNWYDTGAVLIPAGLISAQ